MKELIRELFYFGNYYLTDEILKWYIARADQILIDRPRSFNVLTDVKEIAKEMTIFEIKTIEMMYNKFPNSKMIRLLAGCIRHHLDSLEIEKGMAK